MALNVVIRIIVAETIHSLVLLSRFVDVLELMHLILNYIIDHSGFFASLKCNGDHFKGALQVSELCVRFN